MREMTRVADGFDMEFTPLWKTPTREQAMQVLQTCRAWTDSVVAELTPRQRAASTPLGDGTWSVKDLLDSAEAGEIPLSPEYEAALRLRRSVIEAQRAELLAWRDVGKLPDESLRTLERELDHEEGLLPTRSAR